MLKFVSLLCLFFVSSITAFSQATINGTPVRIAGVPISSINNYCISSSETDTYTCNVPGISYADGIFVLFRATATSCSGSATINMSSLGAKEFRSSSGLGNPDCVQNRDYIIAYDSSIGDSGGWKIISGGESGSGTGNAASYITVSFSATPEFVADSNTINSFKITLTGNVTSSTLTNASSGQILIHEICQDGTGGRTFNWPSNYTSPGEVSLVANSCLVQVFYFNGTDAIAISVPWVRNGTGNVLISCGTAPSNAPSNQVWMYCEDDVIKFKNDAGTVFPGHTQSTIDSKLNFTGTLTTGNCLRVANSNTAEDAGVNCNSGGGGTCWIDLQASAGNIIGQSDGWTVRSGSWHSSGPSATGVVIPGISNGLALLSGDDTWIKQMLWPRNCTPGTGYTFGLKVSKASTDPASIGLAFVCVEQGTGGNNPSFPSASTVTITAIENENTHDSQLATWTADLSSCAAGESLWIRLSKTGTWTYIWSGELYKN